MRRAVALVLLCLALATASAVPAGATPQPAPAPGRPQGESEYSLWLPQIHTDAPPGWVFIKQEGFDNGFPSVGWTVYDNGAGPGDYLWAPTTCQSFAGGHSAWAVGGGSGQALGCGANYPNRVQSWLVYGPFSLAGATAARLKFKLMLDSEPGYDGLCYGASPDNVNYFGYCGTGGTLGWADRTLDLADVPVLGDLRGDGSVWIAFDFVSDISNTQPGGAFVDEVIIEQCQQALCPVGAALSSGPPAVGYVEHPAVLTRPKP